MGTTKGGACRRRAMPPRMIRTPLCGDSEVVVCQPCAPAPSPVLPPSTACNCGRDAAIEEAIKANDLDAVKKNRANPSAKTKVDSALDDLNAAKNKAEVDMRETLCEKAASTEGEDTDDENSPPLCWEYVTVGNSH